MLSAVFVDRPRLAIVVAMVITIAGALALYAIPFAQYPDIVPPQVFSCREKATLARLRRSGPVLARGGQCGRKILLQVSSD
jgi:hypothetical protein